MQQPNILLIIADQLAAPALSVYGHGVTQTPFIAALADEGVVFENAYCNSPLCAPSRASLMSGKLPSRIEAYDNAAPFDADVPTIAHHLRALGYRTALSGKMHFVGPDQMHGFEERLTTDIYPADFGWTPDWEHPERRLSWYHNMLSVVQAGPCTVTNQIDYDEEVIFHARRKLLDIARDADPRPFFLVASLTHPHDPYAITRPYWDRYAHDAIDMPTVGPLPVAELDPHSRRIRDMCAMDQYTITEEHVRNARHAYYGAMSYVDDKIGMLLHTLEEIGQRDNTVVIVVSDHGDMLGERGLWYKMTFWEWSSRVPMILWAPQQFQPKRIAAPVSLVDLLPTLVELSGGNIDALQDQIDGHSLLPLMSGTDEEWSHSVIGEYLAEGAVAPCTMLRDGTFKYIWSAADPAQLYDLHADPHEMHNLAEDDQYEQVRQRMAAAIAAHWDADAVRERIIASQRRRRLIGDSMTQGQRTAWDFQPRRDAANMYMRNHLELDDLERMARFPPVASPEEPSA
jgi:choline-sulfatase